MKNYFVQQLGLLTERLYLKMLQDMDEADLPKNIFQTTYLYANRESILTLVLLIAHNAPLLELYSLAEDSAVLHAVGAQKKMIYEEFGETVTRIMVKNLAQLCAFRQEEASGHEHVCEWVNTVQLDDVVTRLSLKNIRLTRFKELSHNFIKTLSCSDWA